MHHVLIEESILGWKEFELEVMRDHADNAIVVCSIENFDPMGIHTGDSITVAPRMTLTDREYQDAARHGVRCITTVGVETGGSNIQFAVDPATGESRRIEMNPRVSRTLGARVEGDRFSDREDRGAARSRLHARRDSKRHHQARRRVHSSPRSTTSWSRSRAGTSRSSRGAQSVLGTQMKSVGEVMAIGRTFAKRS